MLSVIRRFRPLLLGALCVLALGGCRPAAHYLCRFPAPTGTGIPYKVSGAAPAPTVVLDVVGPPSAGVGQEVSYTLSISNTGQAETRSLTVRQPIPEGLQHVRSDPPAIVEGKQLIWTLGELPGGQHRDLRVTFQTISAGRANGRVTVLTAEGQRDEKAFTTAVTQPALKLTMTGPAEGAVGVPVHYRIVVSNPGTGPARDVLLKASFDEGLESPVNTNPIEFRLGPPLGPGQSRAVPLTLTPRRPGSLAARVTATATGGLREQAEHAVRVREARVTVNLAGPKVYYAGRPATWDITVSNPGQVPLRNVSLRNLLPGELEFVGATEGGKFAGGAVAWNLGALKPGEKRTVQVTTNCRALSPATVSRAIVTAEAGLSPGGSPAPISAKSEAVVEVRGLPAFRLDVRDRDDPLEVGRRTAYRIEVTNQGTLTGNQVGVTITVPPELRLLSAAGPSAYQVDGQAITFAPRDGLAPRTTWTYTVEVEALRPGDARLRVKLRAAALSAPVAAEESTRVFGPMDKGTD